MDDLLSLSAFQAASTISWTLQLSKRFQASLDGGLAITQRQMAIHSDSDTLNICENALTLELLCKMFTVKRFTFWHSLRWKADIDTSWSLGTNKNHTIRKFEMDMFDPRGL